MALRSPTDRPLKTCLHRPSVTSAPNSTSRSPRRPPLEFQIAVAPATRRRGDRATVIHVGRQGDSSHGDLRRARQPDPQVRCRSGQPQGELLRDDHRPRPTRRRSPTSTCRRICGPVATPRPTSSSASPRPSSAATPTPRRCWRRCRRGWAPDWTTCRARATRSTARSDTLLAGAGVCRDYAHLVVALLRAVNVPARLVAVYAPGCQPMDFHAVAEAFVDGSGGSSTPRCLAPRQTLVRIATGRDAADTAFLDNHKGADRPEQRARSPRSSTANYPIDSVDDLVSLRLSCYRRGLEIRSWRPGATGRCVPHRPRTVINPPATAASRMATPKRQAPVPAEERGTASSGVLCDEDQQHDQDQEAEDERRPQRGGPGE